MTVAPRRIVVVGASAAGLTAVETLRAEAFDGEITLVGAERRAPYDRPPLSKQVLSGTWAPSRTELRPEASYEELDLSMRLGRSAVGLDVRDRTVTLDDASRLEYDALLIATGVRPREIPAMAGSPGVHVLRTLDDALAFRAAALTADPVLVVGAGFLGTEVAATLTVLGRQVTMVDAERAPMRRQLGRVVAERLHRLHTERGVDVRTETALRHCLPRDGGGVDAVLTDGTVVRTGCILIAIGATPATQWLGHSGLRIDDGVVCDPRCQAAPGVHAAGDVASWTHRGSGARLRVEHRTNATEQAITAARNMLGADEPYLPVPYFWSDQFGVKIQVYGSVTAATEFAVIHGDPNEDTFVALYGSGGRVVGALGWRAPRELLRARSLVAGQVPWQEVCVAERT
ncbi:MAG: NAD(P)/FAD-dependent oxidoreductase [Streptosporangiales bacterium]|nr:NAD(P)/FAD-dependent oxidoreductase [Streptosporangiales bacterium]